jgi:ribosomal protein S18 acetylase RimI-like enzyme
MITPPVRRVDVVRTHLEMRQITALRPARPIVAGMALTREIPTAADYRTLYSAVGQRWHWRDRLQLSDEELDAHFASDDVRLFVLRTGDDLAGYFELQQHPDGRVEIMYFGLTAAYIGLGLGGSLLTRAVEEAFALGASHVTLHTCTLDAPAALPNYLARGFVIVRVETYVEEIASTAAAAK